MSEARSGADGNAGQPAVSVVVPFHRTPGAFLREAIESVLGQTFGSLELLLVDDAGSGEARAVAMEAATRDPARVRLLAAGLEEPRGRSAARNAGLEAARGRLFALLDADDVWLPDKLDAHVAALDAEPSAAMAYGDTLYWFGWDAAGDAPQDDYVPASGFEPGTVIRPPELVRRFLSGDAAVPCTCSVVVRTEVARRLGGFDAGFPGLYDDQVYYARIACTEPVLYTGGVRERYRRHAASCCATAGEAEEVRARLRFLDWLESWLDERGVDDAGLSRLVRRERAMLRHPAYGRVVRKTRAVLRRAPRAGGRS